MKPFSPGENTSTRRPRNGEIANLALGGNDLRQRPATGLSSARAAARCAAVAQSMPATLPSPLRSPSAQAPRRRQPAACARSLAAVATQPRAVAHARPRRRCVPGCAHRPLRHRPPRSPSAQCKPHLLPSSISPHALPPVSRHLRAAGGPRIKQQLVVQQWRWCSTLHSESWSTRRHTARSLLAFAALF